MSERSITFHELSFVPEGDDVVVGRTDTDSYAVLPAEGAALLRELAHGMHQEQAARWFESTFGEQVDIDDFLESLQELGFVESAGPADLTQHSDRPAPSTPSAPVSLRWLGQAAFSPLAWLCYAVAVVCYLLVAARHSDLLPRPEHIFFTGPLAVVQLGITFGQLPLIFMHEGFHALAGRRLGLRSRMSVGNRYMYIVFETTLTGLWSVARRKRYLPFLSGMLCDVVLLSLLGLLADATRQADGAYSLTGRTALAFSFTIFMRIAWQFQFYLRTDIYYVFANALNCHDLHDASIALLRNRIWRLLRRPGRIVDEQQWTERDRRVGLWYGPVILLGIGAMLLITVLGSAPVVVDYFRIAVQHMRTGPGSLMFWDALVAVAMSYALVVLPLYLSRRTRRLSRTKSTSVIAEKVS
jgi:hypothetical protein